MSRKTHADNKPWVREHFLRLDATNDLLRAACDVDDVRKNRGSFDPEIVVTDVPGHDRMYFRPAGIMLPSGPLWRLQEARKRYDRVFAKEGKSE